MSRLVGMDDSNAGRERKPIKDEIRMLWEETGEIKRAFEHIIDRVRRLETDIRGSTTEDDEGPAKQPARRAADLLRDG